MLLIVISSIIIVVCDEFDWHFQLNLIYRSDIAILMMDCSINLLQQLPTNTEVVPFAKIFGALLLLLISIALECDQTSEYMAATAAFALYRHSSRFFVLVFVLRFLQRLC